MIKGIYTAAAGMMAQMAKQDVVANNIANVNTYGFKKDTTLCRSFPEMLISRLGETTTDADGIERGMQPVVIGTLGTGAAVDKIITDFSAGNLTKTDNSTDAAINDSTGSMFFVVRAPDGQQHYTRDGAFKINSQGLLTTSQGYPVLDDQDNPIMVVDVENNPDSINGNFAIDGQGQVLVNDEPVAKLKIVQFPNLQVLQKTGGTWTSNQQPNQVANPQIMPGYIEESNVNSVKEMVNLITVVRAYESLQKVVDAEDQTTQIAIDEVGSVS